MIRWGDPLFATPPSSTRSRQPPPPRPAVRLQLRLPRRPAAGGPTRAPALAVVNHEYTNENIMFPPTTDPAMPAEQKRIAWRPTASPSSSCAQRARSAVVLRAGQRATTGASPARRPSRSPARPPVTPLLRTADDPTGQVVLGTLNNCAGGTTPWGTVLTGEENFNQYFVANASARDARRSGIHDATACPATAAGGTRLRRVRRSPAGARNEVTGSAGSSRSTPTTRRPTPVSAPRWAASSTRAPPSVVADDGRVVVYSGDDERFDYVYKFVSDRHALGPRRAPRQT